MIRKSKNPVVRVIRETRSGRSDVFMPERQADALFRQGKLDFDVQTLSYIVRQ